MCSAGWSRLSKNLKSVRFLAGFFMLFSPICGWDASPVDNKGLVSVTSIEEQLKKTSGMAKKRFLAWEKLIVQYRKSSTPEKLTVTNDFFNQFTYINDDSFKGATDYWKTPQEFVNDGGGDCEDFSIAKYFTLLAMDVPIEALRITYVKSIPLNQAHMVLTYYPSPEAEPLVLDNLNAKILPASTRKDLIPVYSFNGEGLWLAKQRGHDNPVGDSSRLGKWRSVLQRMIKGNQQ
ncbi:periplasmic protein [Legionella birminghamensis]|uniref:Periplasmic protein n=1 Tax=Legionella birminghamensis TaxID=28083 RepID=A0A378IBC8_9GAMM|nr:transglutaminase-like cysteine peptidase [Legionella birminghamensis]KTC75188.1 periplasmic protein [Legionella birminghamensis]STX31861.1 periplasmic protein [Legionella birminghamensis]